MIVFAGCTEKAGGVVIIPLRFHHDTPDDDCCTEAGPVGLVCVREAGHGGRCMALTLDAPGAPARVWGGDGYDWSRRT